MQTSNTHLLLLLCSCRCTPTWSHRPSCTLTTHPTDRHASLTSLSLHDGDSQAFPTANTWCNLGPATPHTFSTCLELVIHIECDGAAAAAPSRCSSSPMLQMANSFAAGPTQVRGFGPTNYVPARLNTGYYTAQVGYFQFSTCC
jgi:hypothetical protein